MLNLRSLLRDASTGLLVVCALAITIKDLAGGAASRKPTVARHVANWRALVQGHKPAMATAGAPVAIVEFSDYECPFCRSLEPELKTVAELNVGKVEVVRYDFPLTIHRHAYGAAVAAECAAAQGVYEPFQAMLFSGGEDFDSENWLALAKDAEVPGLGSFSTCLRQQQPAEIIAADEKVGRDIGVRATPTLIIDGDILEGSPTLETIQSFVRRNIAGGSRGGILEWFRERFRGAK